MSGDHDKYHGTAEVVKYGGVYLSAKEINELLEALEEAVYLLNPTDEDMQKKAGVYRVVSALEKFRPEDVCKVESYIGQVKESLLKRKKQ